MHMVILYKSNTGYTKAYAEILAEKLVCDAFSLDKIRNINLTSYDTIIFGGSVRASKISGLKKVLKELKPLKDQNIVIFAVGANGKSDENTQKLRDLNLKNQDANYPLFYMQGGFDPQRLGFFLKIMLKNVAKSIRKKEAKDPALLSESDREFLSFFQDSHSEVSEENTIELLDYISSLWGSK